MNSRLVNNIVADIDRRFKEGYGNSDHFYNSYALVPRQIEVIYRLIKMKVSPEEISDMSYEEGLTYLHLFKEENNGQRKSN